MNTAIWSRFAWFVSGLLLATPAALGADTLREEFRAVAGEPYTTTVAAATASDTIAWVTGAAGVVSLWTAAGPQYAPRLVTQLPRDTGDLIEDLTLSADGRWLVYSRGPSPSPKGRTPNPAGLIDGLENALWITATRSGVPVKLAVHASSPSFAPDSRRLLYLRDNQPNLVRVTASPRGPKLSAAKVLFKDFGSLSELTWSPAGDTIAFVSARAAHGFIGTYHIDDDRVHYIAPSVNNDAGVAWSPDGEQLAFIRLPGSSATDVRDVMQDQPFSVWVASASGANSREIYRSPGRDAGEESDGRVHWLKDGRVLFMSDADGYSHLYSVDPKTRSVSQLTHGACDIESVVLNGSADRIAVTGNCFDAARREIAVQALGAAGWSRWSSAGSVATDPKFIGKGDAVLYRSATYDRTQMPAIRSAAGDERLVGAVAMSATSLQRPEVVHFNAPDGTPLTGIWFAPQHVAPGTRAAGVVYVHGGPIRQMFPAWHTSSYYAYAYAANQLLALHGVGVLAINYRTGVGFGRAFRSVAHYGPHGIEELQDVIAAGEYLRGRPEIDGQRIGIYGGSYGGHLAANALARRSDLFSAGVCWHGIYDFSQWATNVGHPNRNFTSWGVTAANLDIAFENSALSQVKNWRSPTLLIAGDDDHNVDFAETVTLYRALEEAGAPIEAYVLPNEIHGFLRFSSWAEVIDRTGEFLIDHLAAQNAP